MVCDAGMPLDGIQTMLETILVDLTTSGTRQSGKKSGPRWRTSRCTRSSAKQILQEAIRFKELAWTYQQQRCEIDKDCFQHGLDPDRKQASIAHHRTVRESMDPTTRLWSDALVCLLWYGLVCLWFALMLCPACSGLVWFACGLF